MAYLRISDDAMDHPKLQQLSDGAFRLWFNANCWCQKHLSDGKIPMTSVVHIPWYRPTRVRELVSAGLWREHPGRYEVHDFLVHNDSREKVQERRKRKAEKVAEWRKRQEERRRNQPRTVPVTLLQTDPVDPPLTSPHLSSSKELQKKEKEQRSDHPVRSALAHYADRFQQTVGQKPEFKAGKDAKLVSTVIKSRGLEETKALIDALFDCDDPFLARAGYSLGAWSASLNKLILWRQKGPEQAPITRAEYQRAEQIRRQFHGRCPHEPKCGNYEDCIRQIALQGRGDPAA